MATGLSGLSSNIYSLACFNKLGKTRVYVYNIFTKDLFGLTSHCRNIMSFIHMYAGWSSHGISSCSMGTKSSLGTCRVASTGKFGVNEEMVF